MVADGVSGNECSLAMLSIALVSMGNIARSIRTIALFSTTRA